MQKPSTTSGVPGGALRERGRDTVRRYGGVERVTMAAAIYEQLRQAIVGVSLLPGEALQEKALIERFGVSRTPVREALLHLVKDGLVEMRPQSGTFVAQIAVDSLAEALVIRAALEETAVTAAVARATPADVARLDAILDMQAFCAGRGDADRFHETDEAFHEAISAIAGYPTIWKILRQVKVQLDRLRRLTLPGEGRMPQVTAEHRAIRDAIAAGDAEAARTAMKRHLEILLPDFDRLRAEHPSYFI